MAGPNLSIIIPIYNETATFSELMRRLKDSVSRLDVSCEVILIDDGSTDGSLDLIREVAGRDKTVRFISFSRNFGHQMAISAGLDRAAGDGVVVMDGDLQDPPEVLQGLVKKWREGWDVVYAVREARKEGVLLRGCYYTFYRVLQFVADVRIPLDAGDFCLMDRKVVDILNSLPERNRYVRGIRAWVGFKQAPLPYERDRRYAGEPKYSFRAMMKLAIDGITSFSHFPLRLCGYVGIFMAFLSFLGLCYGLLGRLLYSTPPGWSSLIMAVFFIGGVQLIMLSMVGSYVGRIYTEVQNRPLYVIKEESGGSPTS